MQPKVSIITVCYNSENTIEDTLQSVINQTYDNIEYIIIDGNSTDNTLEIINKYQGKVAKVISENDDGLYDAINKGIDIATGEIIANLNSDDFYIDNTVIADVVDKMQSDNSDTLYADLYYVEALDSNKVVRNWVSGEYKKGMFFKGWMPPHPTFFVRKSVYDKYGKFNLELKSAADYEIMLRFIHKHECSISYLPRVVVRMRVGGVSNVSIKNRLKANREDKRAWELNGLKPKPYTLIFKPLSKVLQFVKK
jgi:glycosyltransferase